MSFVDADRVKETSVTEGTAAYALGGALAGFRTFAAGVGLGNQSHYVAEDGLSYEVGIGTVSGSPVTLSRDRIIASSNAGAAVSWGPGTRTVFCAPVAEGTFDDEGSDTTFPAVEAGSVNIGAPARTNRFVRGLRVWRRTIAGHLPARMQLVKKVNGVGTLLAFSVSGAAATIVGHRIYVAVSDQLHEYQFPSSTGTNVYTSGPVLALKTTVLQRLYVLLQNNWTDAVLDGKKFVLTIDYTDPGNPL